MNYISVFEFAKRHGITDRTVRNYCSQGKLAGAFLTRKIWNVPEDAVVIKSTRKSKECPLLKKPIQLQQWQQIPEYLRDTCLTAQDNYKATLDYFRIK